MTNRIYIFSAAILLAGCSSAQAAPNTSIVSQSGPDLVSAYTVAPTPVIPPLIVPAPEPVDRPVVVERVVQRLSCDIEVKRTSHGIRVTPIVHAGRSLSGEFSLVITKDGAGGSSDITQGGPFDAARGERVKLSSSEFSMERGAKFRAVLKVRSGGHEVCRDVRSKI
jgi:hypothetical protein